MTFNLTLSSNDVVFVNFTNLFPGVDDVMQAVPTNRQQILKDGGLVAHLKKRFENEA